MQDEMVAGVRRVEHARRAEKHDGAREGTRGSPRAASARAASAAAAAATAAAAAAAAAGPPMLHAPDDLLFAQLFSAYQLPPPPHVHQPGLRGGRAASARSEGRMLPAVMATAP